MACTAVCDRRRWVLSMLREYEVPLTRFATRLLGDDDAARDVVQFAFLRLCDRSDGTPDDDSDNHTARWLYTVCRNKAVDHLRMQRRMGRLGETEMPTRMSRESDPAQAAEREDLYRQLTGAIDHLPESQRETVLLWAEGFSYREISKITDRTEVNIRVLVHRALQSLRTNPTVQAMAE
ncbi:MAG: sigma-70 family RNA polymerase sigma factor [Thermoguttaceae bacterium]